MNLRPLLLPIGALVCGFALAPVACATSTDDTPAPLPDAGDTGADTGTVIPNVVTVSAGASHTCAGVGSALQNDIFCWGSNSFQQITISSTDLMKPSPVLAGEGMVSNATFMAAGLFHTCVVNTAGEVWCWGQNTQGQLGVPDAPDTSGPQFVDLGADSTPTFIAAGAAFTCIVSGDSTVKCWGANDFGQIGKDPTLNKDPFRSPMSISVGGSVKGLCAGESHACAIVSDAGNVKCWGANDGGQLGDGTSKAHFQPSQVLSNGSSTPALAGAAKLACGPNHTCAMMQGGGVKCWGANNAGQLGLGESDGGTAQKVTKPTDVFPSSGELSVVDLCAGGLGQADTDDATKYRGFTCGLISDGSVRCWGANDLAQLGNGTTEDNGTPTTLPELAGVSALSCGGSHGCAVIGVTEPKSLKCWGSNVNGQIGDGTTDTAVFPVDVTGL